jgi:predicted enzyme related to lactoylglutathione lyase
MPERTSYAEGTPSWVDLSSPDIGASTAFYGELFGWDSAATGPVEETGGYEIFTLGGKRVAGVAALQDPAQPPMWSTYIAVDDADETAAKATAAGGHVAVAPMDIMTAGRMAFLVDPTGASIGIWQAGDHTGAEVVNEPVSLGWNELMTRSPEEAKAFYSAVFGMTAAPWDVPGGRDYVVWQVDGKMVGGLLAMDDENFPPEMPSNWAIYFVVPDADAIAAKAGELGGATMVEPFDAPGVGRIAILADPHRAVFGVISGEPPAE